jgi:hypothetical protein
MRTVRIMLPVLFLSILALSAYGQEEPPPSVAPEETYSSNSYVRGEQTLSFNLGGFIPLTFVDLYAGGGNATNLKFGAGFGLAYNYVVSPGFSVGGEIEGATCATTRSPRSSWCPSRPRPPGTGENAFRDRSLHIRGSGHCPI